MIASFRQRLLDELARTEDQDDSGWQRWRGRIERALDVAAQQLDIGDEDEHPLTDPVLQGGAVVHQSVIAYRDPFVVPAGCHLKQSLFATGRVEIGRNSRIDGDLVADSAFIAGGGQSRFRHLMAGTLQFESAPQAVTGNIWCDLPFWRAAAGKFPPQLAVRGVVAVRSPDLEGITVQPHSEMGALIARSPVHTESHCRIGHLYSERALTLGRDNMMGRVEGGTVLAPHDCRLVAVISEGALSIQGSSLCDTLRAVGDISLGKDVVVTGPVIISIEGRFRFPVGTAWHTRRDHWFYETEAGTLLPVSGGRPRPEQSRLVALQSLNHTLWEQMSRLRGEAA